MTRPAIDPANIRQQSRTYLITRYWVRRIFPYALFIAAIYVIGCIHTLDAQLNGYMP